MKKTLLYLLLALGLHASQTHTAKIIETLNSGGYSYIKVQEGEKAYWIAMTQRPLKAGGSISFEEQGWMQKFHSKTLNRTFDAILFASDAQPSEQKHEELLEDIDHSDYQTKETITVAELFKKRSLYAGKRVKVRGRVTKVSNGIMKRNWVHIQDGSRFQNADDLVFTSEKALPEVGSLIVAEGLAVKDRDFGYGYFYPVIVEDAKFTQSANIR